MFARQTKKLPYRKKHSSLHRFGLFLIAFAAVGGGFMLYKSSAATTYASYPPHHAACIQNTPSKSYVRPGENFTAVVKMKNDGTSNFSPSYGFILAEFNNGVETNYWNDSGGTLSGDVTPGNTATFNLSVRAPSQPATYGFNWAMLIIYNGVVREPCTGQNVVVKNPPIAALNLNGTAGNITLTQGSGLTVSWSASNGATSCSASGNWSGAKSPPSGGSENRTVDTSTVGTKTYTLVCSNEVGAGTAISRSVTVTAAPPPPAPASPAPSGSSPVPSSSSGTSASSTVPIVTADTTPPSVPAGFQANYNESVVDLSWSGSTDDHGVSGYELERSTDQTAWQRLGGTITSETFSDPEVTFDTTYYYRLRALDQAGNASGYATAQITTGGFSPNAKAGEALVLTSDDGVVRVSIPAGALAEVAACDLRASRYLPPSPKDYDSISGPYELLCKVASGSRITAFAQPVTVQVNLSDSQKKRYGDHKFYTRASDWEEVKDVSADNGFVLGDSADFAILGKTKKTPLWQKVLITLFILTAVIGGGLFALSYYYRWRLKRRLEQQNRDNYYKERGY